MGLTLRPKIVDHPDPSAHMACHMLAAPLVDPREAPRRPAARWTPPCCIPWSL